MLSLTRQIFWYQGYMKKFEKFPQPAHSMKFPELQNVCCAKSNSALMNGDSNPLPGDVTQVIFQALNLSMTEKKEILYLLEIERGVTIAVMRDYITDRFKTYETIASALGSARNPKPPLPHSRIKPANINAASANTQENDKYEDEDDEEQPSYSNDEANNVEKNEFKKTGDSKRNYVRPICLFCQKKDLPENHWIQYCVFIKPSSKSELQDMWLCTFCLYLKNNSTMQYCKDFYCRNSFFFCSQC